MNALRLGRYLLISVVLGAVLAGAAEFVLSLLGRGGAAASCRIAIAVVILSDLPAYNITGRGVLREKHRFLTLWGLGLLSKLGCLVAASAALVVADCVQRNEYLLALAVAFLVFTTRQAVVLVGLLQVAKDPTPSE